MNQHIADALRFKLTNRLNSKFSQALLIQASFKYSISFILTTDKFVHYISTNHRHASFADHDASNELHDLDGYIHIPH